MERNGNPSVVGKRVVLQVGCGCGKFVLKTLFALENMHSSVVLNLLVFFVKSQLESVRVTREASRYRYRWHPSRRSLALTERLRAGYLHQATSLALVVFSWMCCSSTNDRCPASWTGTSGRCCQLAETPGTQQARDDADDTGSVARFLLLCHQPQRTTAARAPVPLLQHWDRFH